MMKIGIAALLVHPLRIGGAETYARNLLAALARVDQENEYTVFVANGSDFETAAPNFQVVKLAAPVANPYLRVLFEHTILPRKIAAHDLDLVHFLGSTAPYRYRQRAVVTIHDTLRFQAPATAPRLLSAYFQWIQADIARTNKHVLAVSQADAAVMARHLQLDAARLHVAPLGVEERFFERSPEQPQKESLLWLGRNYSHKNIETLLQAYAILCSSRSAPRLRLVGMSPADVRSLGPKLRDLGIADSVDLEPAVPHQAVPQLLRSALIFCLPSVCESFGLPVLEAMASGTAVVCSSLDSFRELFGDAVRVCDPHSPEEFAAAIGALLDDPAARIALETAGRNKAHDFTWDACAEKTLGVYQAILSGDAL